MLDTLRVRYELRSDVSVTKFEPDPVCLATVRAQSVNMLHSVPFLRGSDWLSVSSDWLAVLGPSAAAGNRWQWRWKSGEWRRMSCFMSIWNQR